MYSEWLDLLEKADKTSIISSRCRKIHYKFPDNSEMVEEYNADTGVILRRAWKRKAFLQKDCESWEVELGDSVPDIIRSDGELLLKESNSEPFVSKRITKHSIEWRIRNLPFPLETYLVTANKTERTLTVRTTNKKFFKTIPIQELIRCNTDAQQDNVSLAHQHNTLIITYQTPTAVKEMERAVLLMLQDVETTQDLDCGDLLQHLVN